MKCSSNSSNRIRQAAGHGHHPFSRGGLLALALALAGVLAVSGCGITGASSGQLSPLSKNVNFGNVTTGASSVQNITLTNKGPNGVTISQVNVSGTGFSVIAMSLPMTIPAGQNAVIPVKFTPANTGTVTGTLTIISNVPGAPLTIPLNAAGVTAATAQISLNPSSINFGSVTVGGTSKQLVTMTNMGSANLTVNQVTVQGSASYSVSGLALPLTLTPNQQASFTVTFTASAAGSATGQMSWWAP